jgi:homoserine kinase type II
VFFDEAGRLSGVIDFYFACVSAFAYDLAIAVNAWCFDKKGQIVTDNLNAFLNAYESIRPLSADERAAFPGLRRAGALRILMTRFYDFYFTPKDATVVKHDPAEYLAKLKSDFKWP